MTINISGPGVGLPLPQNLYPSQLGNAPADASTNAISLAGGEAWVIPAGKWLINLGKYGSLQFLDPVTQIWTGLRSRSEATNAIQIQSEGFSFRVANLTGCAVAAVVTNPGSAYVQSTTTVTPSAGNSTWQAIVGGQITSISVATAGSSYGVAPQVVIDAPPAPGVQATAVAVISGGSVTSITLINQGAGYTATPNAYLVPNASDPNAGTITNGTLVATVGGSGKITAVLCTNPGAPVATTMSLTVAGAGSSGAVTPVFMNTVTGASIVSGGTGYTVANELTTIGGVTAATATFTNPIVELTGYNPRPAIIGLAQSGGTLTSITTIYDGGLFTGTPSPIVITDGIVTTVASVTLTLGAANETIRVQSL